MRAGTHIDLSIWYKSRWIACTKWQVRSGTHSDLLFWSKSRCFTFKNHRWGLGPRETCYSGPKVAVLHSKTTDEGSDQERHVIPVQKSLFCIQKPQMKGGTHIHLLFRCKSRWIACTKPQIRTGTQRDMLFWSKSRCFASKNHRWGLGPIETCYSGPKVAILHPKTTDGDWDH